MRNTGIHHITTFTVIQLLAVISYSSATRYCYVGLAYGEKCVLTELTYSSTHEMCCSHYRIASLRRSELRFGESEHSLLPHNCHKPLNLQSNEEVGESDSDSGEASGGSDTMTGSGASETTGTGRKRRQAVWSESNATSTDLLLLVRRRRQADDTITNTDASDSGDSDDDDDRSGEHRCPKLTTLHVLYGKKVCCRRPPDYSLTHAQLDAGNYADYGKPIFKSVREIMQQTQGDYNPLAGRYNEPPINNLFGRQV